MKNTGMTRAIDEVGRIVIPNEIRKSLNIKPKDELDISIDNDKIILKKIQPNCIFCNCTQGLSSFKGNNICPDCIKKISQLDN